jgi:hypothetical protein
MGYILSALAILVLGASTSSAQDARSSARVQPLEAPSLGVLGTLLDSVTGSPIQAATVELLGADRTTVRRWTISNAVGQFRLEAPAPGAYYLRAWRLALDTLTHGPLELTAGQPPTVTLRARARPIEITPLDVRVEARVRFLLDRGFYDRQMLGAGVFLTPEDLARRTSLDTRELMSGVSGIEFPSESELSFTVSGTQPCGVSGWRRANDVCELAEQRRTRPMLTRSGLSTSNAVPCVPAVYLDGQLVQSSGDVSMEMREFDLATIRPSQILAIEVFRGAAEVPAQWGGGSASCGVVVFWTVAQIPPDSMQH